MARYAYVAGTTNDDINDNGSVACQLDYLKQTGEHYDDYFIDTFNGMCQARFYFQKLLTIVKPGDTIDVMDVSNLTSNARELYCLLDRLEDIHVTVYSNMLILDDICMHEWCTALMLCKADRITRNQHNFNQQKMCQLKHQVNSIRNKDQSITQRDYQIYDLLIKSDYKTAQQATGLSRSTLYRLKKRVQKQ